jgi:YedE family putative selenium metabolism protein
VGAIRDLVLLKDAHLFNDVLALLAAALVTNLTLGLFKPGFQGQPIAHTNALWNFGGMVLSGLAFTLAGGCLGRQLFLAGEGDGDVAIFALGAIVGAGVSHTFNAASAPGGPAAFGPAMVVAGLIVCIVLGLTMRDPQHA